MNLLNKVKFETLSENAEFDELIANAEKDLNRDCGKLQVF